MKIKVINKSNNELPEYSTKGAAAMDIKAYIKRVEGIDIPSFKGDGFGVNVEADGTVYVTLYPGGRVLIPSGLHIALPKGTVLSLRPRSGLALKHGVTVLNTPGTIDEDYRGDIGTIFINHGNKNFIIANGDRIGQLILEKVVIAEFIDVDVLEETVRGEGGFGHTGK